MKSLKKDFTNRLYSNSEYIFSSFSGDKYSTSQITSYYQDIASKFNKNSNNVILICNQSIESHILSLFLILSQYDVYLVSVNFEDVFKHVDNPTIIVFENKTHKYLEAIDIKKSLILAPSITHFLNQSIDSNKFIDLMNDYNSNKNIGKSIFLSSGSTGIPKIIPLRYEEINSCYNSVCEGFLDNLKFSNIISLHDTSFVIILPFIFSLLSKKGSILFACQQELTTKSIFSIASLLDSIDNYILITVPSVLRILLKLIKESFHNTLKTSNIISCGEPLDKNLALNIYSFNPLSFFNLYGSTEVSPWIISLDVNKYLKYFDNNDLIPPVLPAGHALPNVKLALGDSSELLVNSKSVFNGYLNQSNIDVFTKYHDEVFFNSGDLFESKDSQWFCNGRINSAVKIGGVFINPILLEIEIKDKTSLEDIIILPDIANSYIVLVIFKSNTNDSLNTSTNFIKEIIRKNCSKDIPMRFIYENSKINYLKSGKINRKFYNQKFINQ